MSLVIRFLLALFSVLSLAACHSTETLVALGMAPVSATSTPAFLPETDCRFTQPPSPAFVPPGTYSSLDPGPDEFWFGSGSLWTRLRVDGTWQQLPQGDHGYVQKVFWWREGYDAHADPQPDLQVWGRRLDGDAPQFIVSQATNAFGGGLGEAMLVGVGIPTLGCWEITGQIGNDALTFVVWVAP